MWQHDCKSRSSSRSVRQIAFRVFSLPPRTHAESVTAVATTSRKHFIAFDIGRRTFAGVECLEFSRSDDYFFVVIQIWSLRGRAGHFVTSPSFLDSELGDANTGQNREIFRPIAASAGRSILRIG